MAKIRYITKPCPAGAAKKLYSNEYMKNILDNIEIEPTPEPIKIKRKLPFKENQSFIDNKSGKRHTIEKIDLVNNMLHCVLWIASQPIGLKSIPHPYKITIDKLIKYKEKEQIRFI